MVSWIDQWKTVSQIIEEVQTLKAITWLQTAWKSVVPETIQHCFKKCGTQNADWRQEPREKSIAEVIHSENVASSVNESGDEADEGKIRLRVLEALEVLTE